MGAGHASTSIGYAVGIKEGMRQLDPGNDAQGRGRDRRRRDDRRGGVRGDRPGGRSRHPDRGRAQRQRHVDRPQRGGTVALLQPRPSEPEAVAQTVGGRGRPDEAPGRDRGGLRAPRAPPEGVDQGLLGARPVVGGARLGLHGRDRRPRRPRPAGGTARGARGRTPGRGPHRDRQGQGLRPRRGGRARGHGEVARRQAQLDRQRLSGPPKAAANGPPRDANGSSRRSTPRCSGRRSCGNASATSAWSGSPPR